MTLLEIAKDYLDYTSMRSETEACVRALAQGVIDLTRERDEARALLDEVKVYIPTHPPHCKVLRARLDAALKGDPQ